MKLRTSTALLTTLTLVAMLTACSTGEASEESQDGGDTKLTVGIVGIGSDAAIKTAIDQGYFAEEGLEVETTVVANPPAGIAAAQSGQLDVAYTPSIPLMNALAQSVELQVVAAADGYPENAKNSHDPSKVDDTAIFVQPDSNITRARDLEGKNVAVPARKAQIEVTVAAMVLKDGGNPSTINWMVLDPASSLQSLQQGRVDAAGLVSPFSTNAQNEGMQLLGNPGLEFFEAGAVGVWIAGEQRVAKDPESMEGFQNAIYKANAYANDHQSEMEELAAEITGVDLETIRTGANNFWPVSVDLEDLQRVDQQLADLGYLSQEVGIDESLIFSGQ